jgi:hypothetical protein
MVLARRLLTRMGLDPLFMHAPLPLYTHRPFHDYVDFFYDANGSMDLTESSPLILFLFAVFAIFMLSIFSPPLYPYTLLSHHPTPTRALYFTKSTHLSPVYQPTVASQCSPEEGQ